MIFNFTIPIFLILLVQFTASQLTNVKTALFRDNNWVINVNYLSANSSLFGREYILKAECETDVQFQEVFCLGKSISVTITNMFDSQKVYNLFIESNQNYNCSINVQNPNEAAMIPLYSNGQITLPKGVYSIVMNLDDYEDVLGFRGYAVKASVSLDRLLISRKCRPRHTPNK